MKSLLSNPKLIALVCVACAAACATEPPRPQPSSDVADVAVAPDSTNPDLAGPDAATSDATTPDAVDQSFTLNTGAPGRAYGSRLRSVNVDVKKNLKDKDIERMDRLLCGGLIPCPARSARFWVKTQSDRYVMETGLRYGGVIEALGDAGYEVMVSVVGIPAFLSPDCTGCVATCGDTTFHATRTLSWAKAVEVGVDDCPADLEPCACANANQVHEGISWHRRAPIDAAAPYDWAGYVTDVTERLMTRVPDGPLALALWSEPDGYGGFDHQNPKQEKAFNEMIATATVAAKAASVGRDDVSVGGLDLATPWGEIPFTADMPYLSQLGALAEAGGELDFISFHHYSEPGSYILRGVWEMVTDWLPPEYHDMRFKVGEYNGSLVGVTDIAVCDPRGFPGSPDEAAERMDDDHTVNCDHRGATEVVALAASMLSHEYDNLYLFEAFENVPLDVTETALLELPDDHPFADWEVGDPHDYLVGRMGLFTQDFVPRPRATALWMMAHLDGESYVENRLGGTHPMHMLGSADGDRVTIVLAHQDRSVSEQIARGALAFGKRWTDEIVPALSALCPEAAKIDEEAMAMLAQGRPDAAALEDLCPGIGADTDLVDALVGALAYAADRVGHVGTPATVRLNIDGLEGEVQRWRIDAYNNLAAKAYRLNGWAYAEEDSADLEADLLDVMETPIDTLLASNGVLELEVPAESVTLLVGNLAR